MIGRRRSGVDRRTGKDRRRAHNLGRFLYTGGKNRRNRERRSRVERRAGWVRMSKWSSVFLRDLKIAKFLS